MDLIIDFMEDWKAHMLSEIVRLGYSASNNEPINSISYKFFSIKQRRIEPRPRRVHESAEFTHPVDHSAGYSALKEKIQLGEDLSPHLSKSLLDEGYKDMLLNDWGIHHFHLGTAIDNTGFAQRTGPLLFAWVSEDNGTSLSHRRTQSRVPLGDPCSGMLSRLGQEGAWLRSSLYGARLNATRSLGDAPVGNVLQHQRTRL